MSAFAAVRRCEAACLWAGLESASVAMSAIITETRRQIRAWRRPGPVKRAFARPTAATVFDAAGEKVVWHRDLWAWALWAAIGLYGVLAYVTAQRTREIGIRMALGAQRFAVMRLVLADVLWLAGIAIVVTLPLAVLLSRTVRSQLYGVSPADPTVLVAGTLMIAVVAMLSALLPARRAATVEPMKALRTE